MHGDIVSKLLYLCWTLLYLVHFYLATVKKTEHDTFDIQYSIIECFFCIQLFALSICLIKKFGMIHFQNYVRHSRWYCLYAYKEFIYIYQWYFCASSSSPFVWLFIPNMLMVDIYIRMDYAFQLSYYSMWFTEESCIW